MSVVYKRGGMRWLVMFVLAGLKPGMLKTELRISCYVLGSSPNL